MSSLYPANVDVFSLFDVKYTIANTDAANTILTNTLWLLSCGGWVLNFLNLNKKILTKWENQFFDK